MKDNLPFIINLEQQITDSIGLLSFLEHPNSIPFQIQRVYWIYDITNEAQRGNHAHIKEEQLMICLNGNAEVTITGCSSNYYNFSLNHPSMALYVPKMHWKQITLAPNALLLCVSSTKYDANDYIKDFDQFKKACSDSQIA